MPGPMFIQPNTVPQGLLVPLAAPSGTGGFAAVLSGLFQPARGLGSEPSGGMSLSGVPVVSSAAVEPVQAEKNSQEVNANLPGPRVATPSDKVSDRFDSKTDGGGVVPDTMDKTSGGAAQIPDHLDDNIDGVGPLPDSTDKIASDADAETTLIATIVGEITSCTPSGPDQAPDGVEQMSDWAGNVPDRANKTSADVDQIDRAAGRVPGGRNPPRTRDSKTSNRATAADLLAGQNTPGVIPAVFGLSSPPAAVRVHIQSGKLEPATNPGSFATTAHPVGGSDTQKCTDPHRPVPQSPQTETVVKLGEVDRSISFATDANPDRSVIRSGAVVGTGEIATLANAPPASPSGNAPPIIPQSARDLPASPAGQVMPALVGLLKTIGGTQSVTVLLQPPALGEVQIRVDRTAEGSAHVDITAERSDTLALLQRDEPRLREMLDLAGVPLNGRSVNFQVATPEQIGVSTSRGDSMAAGSGNSGQGQSGSAWRQNEENQNDPENGPGSGQGQARARWFRAGLDITA
jgi:hypothetical protein